MEESSSTVLLDSLKVCRLLQFNSSSFSSDIFDIYDPFFEKLYLLVLVLMFQMFELCFWSLCTLSLISSFTGFGHYDCLKFVFEIFCQHLFFSFCFFSSSAVDLVELHDAAGPVGVGAAPPAAETEAAARSRRHEPAPLNGRPRRRFVSGRQLNHHQEKREEKNRSLTKTSSN